MNDCNPYVSPAERSSRGGQFWVGCVVGAAACFVVVFLLLVAAGFLAYVRISTLRPAEVPIATPDEIEGRLEVPAAPEEIEASELGY